MRTAETTLAGRRRRRDERKKRERTWKTTSVAAVVVHGAIGEVVTVIFCDLIVISGRRLGRVWNV